MLVPGQPVTACRAACGPAAGITPQMVSLNVTVGPCELGWLDERDENREEKQGEV